MAKIIQIQAATPIPGLRFRGFAGPEDYHNIREIAGRSHAADGIEDSETVEDIARNYAHLINCDLARDFIMAEVDGHPVAYSRLWFRETEDMGYVYFFFLFLLPEWRGKGIGESMVRWCEARIREIAATHPLDIEKSIHCWVSENERYLLDILESEGYRKIRYFFIMVRPDLENIPDCPLPDGIEIRPVKPEHHRMVWDADVEACADMWMNVRPEEAAYRSWLASPLFQPELWQVAWDGDRVAGAVQNWIDHAENEKYHRKWGATENIHVGREWRGRGLAQALIARSFKVLKENGMEQAVLAVDAENPTGALHLYRKMGFREYRASYTYSKDIFPQERRN